MTESINDAWKYPIIYLNTLTRPDREPDLLPAFFFINILHIIRPDIEKPNLLGTVYQYLYHSAFICQDLKK